MGMNVRAERDGPTRRVRAACWVVLVVATAVVTWWLVGDVSETVPGDDADYLLRPLSLSAAQETAIGVSALVAGLAALGALVAMARSRPGSVTAGNVVTVVPLLLAAAYVGLSYRVVTAAVVGANIGGAALVLLGCVVLPVLVLTSVLLGRGERRRRRPEAASRVPG
jgi:hypothetical protein